MTDSPARSLIASFALAWTDAATKLTGKQTELKLLAYKDVAGDGIAGALAVAATWSAAFGAPCSGSYGGVVIFLFKEDDIPELDRLVKAEADGSPKPGSRAVVSTTLEAATTQLGGTVTFGDVTFVDLAIDEARLPKVVGDAVSIGTFSLELGDALQTQVLVLYAPNGSEQELTIKKTPSTIQPPAPQAEAAPPASGSFAPAAAAAPAAMSNVSGSPRRARREEAPRNIERVLDVELEVIVRFGQTDMPLRDVVRLGVGTMIELNRAVDEPVELLVNGRHLARGEVVVVDGYYGIRITEIGTPNERAALL